MAITQIAYANSPNGSSKPLTKNYIVLMRTLLFKNLQTPPHRPHVATTRLLSRQVSIRHTHDFFEVFLIVAGSGTHHVNRRKVEVSAGCLAVIQPEDCHHFSCQAGEELAILNVAMESGWWKRFHQLMGSSAPANGFRRGTPAGHAQLSPKNLRDLRMAFEQLAGRDERPPSDVIDAVLRVIASFRAKDKPVAPAPPPWLEQWRSELLDACDTVSEPLAYWQKRSGRSPEHLARSCRAFYQCTPTDLVNQARIERAKTLLGSSDEKIISIAFASGFGNLANFYRNFLARTGVTPKAWRRQGSATVPLGDD
jgi:AraC family cel operon transcriptional repressor